MNLNADSPEPLRNPDGSRRDADVVQDLPTSLPFEPIAAPTFDMSVDWTLDDLVGYLRTWSATRRYADANAVDPLVALRAELASAWGDAARRRITWPLSVKASRRP